MVLTFLSTWSPSWLSPEVNRLLLLLDPSGFRWLNETFLTIDRGVEFYNTAPLRPDTGFLLSRVGFGLVGLVAVAGAARVYARRTLAGGAQSRFLRWFRRRVGPVAAPVTYSPATVADLEMATRPIGFWKAARVIARSEIRDLVVRPGMYLFVPLILFQVLSTTVLAIGPFNSRILLTSGALAVNQLNTLNLLICFLLLFYTVESLHKERSRRLHEIFSSTPVGTGAVLLGKTLGNSVVAGFILLAALIGDAIMIGWQQLFGGSPVGFDAFPFMATWGLVLIPTFIFWTALVTALFSLFRSRYVVYGLGLLLIIVTVFRTQTGDPLTVGDQLARVGCRQLERHGPLHPARHAAAAQPSPLPEPGAAPRGALGEVVRPGRTSTRWGSSTASVPNRYCWARCAHFRSRPPRSSLPRPWP